MEDSDISLSDDDVETPPVKRVTADERGRGGALAALEADLGLLDLPEDFLRKQTEAAVSRGYHSSVGGAAVAFTSAAKSSSATKKRKRMKMKRKCLIGDPFASAGENVTSAVAAADSTVSARLFPSVDDEKWMKKMSLRDDPAPHASVDASKTLSSLSTTPHVTTFTTKRRGMAASFSYNDVRVDDDDDDDKLDLDMERTRVEIIKYETERMKGKKATAAKMKEYLMELGAKPPKLAAYRNPEHRRNFVKKKDKIEKKERRIRQEMGLKVGNHDERRKKEEKSKSGGKKKRKNKDLAAVGSVGKWNAKTATLKV